MSKEEFERDLRRIKQYGEELRSALEIFKEKIQNTQYPDHKFKLKREQDVSEAKALISEIERKY